MGEKITMDELHFSPPGTFMLPDQRTEYERALVNLAERTEETYARMQNQQRPSFLPQSSFSDYRLEDHLASPRRESHSTSYASSSEPFVHPLYLSGSRPSYEKN